MFVPEEENWCSLRLANLGHGEDLTGCPPAGQEVTETELVRGRGKPHQKSGKSTVPAVPVQVGRLS
jgi:hypothetical protein